MTETGWGEFEVQIKIFFVPEAGEKPLTILHHLKLHPWSSSVATVGAQRNAPVSDASAHASQAASSFPPSSQSEPHTRNDTQQHTQQDVSLPAAISPPPVVHSWQYEEIVFPEPLEAFYDILIAHPPTPWPATSADALLNTDSLSSSSHNVHTPTGQLIDALSLEAQRAEADRIDLARIDAVQQLDADRAKLIHTEKLLRDTLARLSKLEPASSLPTPSP